MSHIESLVVPQFDSPVNATVQCGNCKPLVLMIDDGSALFRDIEMICDFLELGVECVPGSDDLSAILAARRPMAVITAFEGEQQDGCCVLMTVAAHDRRLPVMVLACSAAAAGAVDAVAELWGLGSVVVEPGLPKVGRLVDFLFHAGRRAGVSRMMPVSRITPAPRMAEA